MPRSECERSSERPRLPDADRRSEQRSSAGGTVVLQFGDPGLGSFTGELLDVSNGGFRVAHQYSGLQAGQVIGFSHAHASGTARVIWNRILKGVVQSGFLVLCPPSPRA